MNFTGKTALVTGAAVGVGKATAIQMASYGANVVLVDRNEEALAKAKAEIPQQDRVMTVVCDVTDAEAVSACVASAVERFGAVDILVNNAGIWRTWASFLDTSIEDWKQYIDVNVMGTVYFSKAVLPGMLHKKSGSIVNISSIWGVVGASCEVPYSAAKGAVITFTQALAKELGLSGIRVNCVAPGVIETDMMASFTAEDKAALAEETPLGRIGTPEDVAAAVVFLAGGDAAFITGQTLGVDGGFGR